MEGQDIGRLEEPSLENEHVCHLKAGLLEEGVIWAWTTEGRAEEGARRGRPWGQNVIGVNVIADGGEREIGIVKQLTE